MGVRIGDVSGDEDENREVQKQVRGKEKPQKPQLEPQLTSL